MNAKGSKFVDQETSGSICDIVSKSDLESNSAVEKLSVCSRTFESSVGPFCLLSDHKARLLSIALESRY